MTKISEQLEREKKITQESKKIKKNYKDLSKDKLKAIEGLIKDASFLRLNLDELMDDMIKNDTVEIFEQGTQRFHRERPQVKIYSTFLQRYNTTMKQLIELMPVEIQKEESDELMLYMKKKKAAVK